MKPAVACLALLAACASPRPPAPAAPAGVPSAAPTPSVRGADVAGPVDVAPPRASAAPGIALQVAPGQLTWQERATTSLTVRLVNEAVDCLWVNARMLLCDDRRCELRPSIQDPAGKRVGALYWVQVQPASRDDYRTVLRGQAVETSAELTFRDYDFRTPGRYTMRLVYEEPAEGGPLPPPGCVALEGKAVSNPVAVDR